MPVVDCEYLSCHRAFWEASWWFGFGVGHSVHKVRHGGCEGPCYWSRGRKGKTQFIAEDHFCIRHSQVWKVIMSVVGFVFLVEPQPIRIAQKRHSMSLLWKGLWCANYCMNASLILNGTAQSKTTEVQDEVWAHSRARLHPRSYASTINDIITPAILPVLWQSKPCHLAAEFLAEYTGLNLLDLNQCNCSGCGERYP